MTVPKLNAGAALVRVRAHWAYLVLLAILLFSAVIRIVSLNWGFPFLMHPDEPFIVRGSIDMIARHSFEPPWSLRPDHLEMQIDDILFQAYSHLTGKHAVADFAQHPTPYYWIARFETACFGILATFMAFLVGRLRSVRTGLFAAALLAIYPGLVLHSHYATPDVPLTCLVLVLIYALMRYLRSPRWPSLLWASFALAAGVAIKYPAAIGSSIIGLTVLVVAIRDRQWKRGIVHLIGAGAASVGFLFAISPVLFTNIHSVIHSVRNESKGNRLGNPGGDFVHNAWYYVTNFFGFGSVLILVFVLFGAYVVIRRRELQTIPWIAGVAMWLGLSTLPLVWQRWGLPMYVTPLLLAAVGADELLAVRKKAVRWVAVVLIAIIGLSYISTDVATDTSLGSPKVLGTANAYLLANGITPQNSAYEGYTPFLSDAPHLLFPQQVKTVGTGYQFLTMSGAPAQYVILSQNMYGRIETDARYAWARPYYTWIRAHGTLVKQFRGLTLPGPDNNDFSSISRAFSNIGKYVDGNATQGGTIQVYRMPLLTPAKGH